MCATCGCGHDHAHDHEHPHRHDHQHHHHEHDPGDVQTRTIALERDLLAKNDALATRNREHLGARGIVMVNLMSSPGAGKTTLLERIIWRMSGERPVAVIEGDQETDNDAARIRGTGAPVVQINTGTGCHLDADMVHRGLEDLSLPAGALVLVENVGNLVCPSLFDLGERARVVVMAVTEGEDKPLKYPHMFRSADLVVLNKVDLLPHLDVDLDRCLEYIQRVRPGAPVLQVSASRGDGLDGLCGWIRRTCGVPGASEVEGVPV